MKFCIRCNESFAVRPYCSQQKFCSERCRSLSKRDRYRKRKGLDELPDIVLCEVCGTNFSYDGSKNNKKYCSKTCKEISYRKSERAYQDSWFKKKYGLSVDDYEKMFSKQGGKCLICSTHQDELNMRLAVDHCHKSGVVRGLLCQQCNWTLGTYEKILEDGLLDNIMEYLR